MVFEQQDPVHGEETRIAEALDSLQEEMEPVRSLVEAFRRVFIETARLKAQCNWGSVWSPPQLDQESFEKGVSLLKCADLIDFEAGHWRLAMDRLLPALEQGFPKLEGEIQAIRRALEDGSFDGQEFLRALSQDSLSHAEHLAQSLGVDLRTAGFVLGHVARPLVEERARGLGPLVRDPRWHRGYCPICGSMPDVALLKGEEGQRWLKCSFCSHQWRFARLACPFCETDDPSHLLVHHVVGREQERLETCTQCQRYILCLDLRGRMDEALIEAAALGMVHLDVIAQQKGLLPMAWSPWNVVSRDDLSLEPVEIGPRLFPS
jgi:FdhE protein